MARPDRFLILTLMVLGMILLSYYAAAPQTRIASPFEGFAIATNLKMIHLTQVVIGLDVMSEQLSLSGRWDYINQSQVGKAFNIVFALPFLVQDVPPPFSYLYNPTTIGSWQGIDTNITNVAASAVSVGFSGNTAQSITGDFSGQFSVSNTFSNSQRGSYAILLPLDAGVDGPLFPGLTNFEWQMNTTCCTEASEIDVYIAIPRSAVSIQTFPTAKLGVNPYDATSDIVTWNMTQRAQVSLFYVDQNEQSSYEISVILGSLLLGAAISGVADWLKERSTKETWYLGLEEP